MSLVGLLSLLADALDWRDWLAFINAETSVFVTLQICQILLGYNCHSVSILLCLQFVLSVRSVNPNGLRYHNILTCKPSISLIHVIIFISRSSSPTGAAGACVQPTQDTSQSRCLRRVLSFSLLLNEYTTHREKEWPRRECNPRGHRS